ncbi:thiamin biosynthesis lipoprotein ApbE, partial [Rhodopirellula maiorica SM1]
MLLGSVCAAAGEDQTARSSSVVNATTPASSGAIRELRGDTMGTTYMVKIYNPPEFESDVAIEVDAELRSVNDQMSTYLKSSEISRFNDSDSTDWFDVSLETAEVVSAALEIAEATDGAFDVTVGPLVNAWSFGPDPKTNEIPSDTEITSLRESVGYKKLAVRIDPPALKKSVPELKVDLSSIAKGHGVDRVVELLARLGAESVFVE